MNKKTILVVDDEPIVLNVTEVILKNAGYVVITAESGEAAMQMCEEMKDELALVVTDVRMPGISGFDLANCISASPFPVPVILMSGFVPSENVMAELMAKMTATRCGFIHKPFRPKELLDLAESALKTSMV